MKISGEIAARANTDKNTPRACVYRVSLVLFPSHSFVTVACCQFGEKESRSPSPAHSPNLPSPSPTRSPPPSLPLPTLTHYHPPVTHSLTQSRDWRYFSQRVLIIDYTTPRGKFDFTFSLWILYPSNFFWRWWNLCVGLDWISPFILCLLLAFEPPYHACVDSDKSPTGDDSLPSPVPCSREGDEV